MQWLFGESENAAPPKTLKITIKQATGLKHRNISGDNIFCSCKFGSKSWKTQKIKNSLEPVWNETQEVEWIKDAENKIIVNVLDSGMMVDKTEGKVEVSPEQFLPNGFEGELPIAGADNAMLSLKIEPVYLAPPKAIRITIQSASGLKSRNLTGDNIFCTCSVGKQSWSTSKVKNALTPSWNESGELAWKLSDEKVTIKILDEGMLIDKSEGTLEVLREKFIEAGFEGDLPITGCDNATLSLRIELVYDDNEASAEPTSDDLWKHMEKEISGGKPTETEPNPDNTATDGIDLTAFGLQSQGGVSESAVPDSAVPDLALESTIPPKAVIISINHANGLKHRNMTGDNMYCICHVGSKKWSTAKVKHDLMPSWNETKTMEWPTGADKITVEILDEGMFTSKTEGKVEVPKEKFVGSAFEGDLPIVGCEGALLNLRIEPSFLDPPIAEPITAEPIIAEPSSVEPTSMEPSIMEPSSPLPILTPQETKEDEPRQGLMSKVEHLFNVDRSSDYKSPDLSTGGYESSSYDTSLNIGGAAGGYDTSSYSTSLNIGGAGGGYDSSLYSPSRDIGGIGAYDRLGQTDYASKLSPRLGSVSFRGSPGRRSLLTEDLSRSLVTSEEKILHSSQNGLSLLPPDMAQMVAKIAKTGGL